MWWYYVFAGPLFLMFLLGLVVIAFVALGAGANSIADTETESGTLNCFHCGRETSVGRKTCESCGRELQA